VLGSVVLRKTICGVLRDARISTRPYKVVSQHTNHAFYGLGEVDQVQ
jgi:hypothetical protein